MSRVIRVSGLAMNTNKRPRTQRVKFSIVSVNIIAILHDYYNVKDTHREKAPTKETPVLTKSMNMGIWVFGTSNQLFTVHFFFFL